MVLPKVRHLMGEGGKALLVGAAFEVRRIQRDLVGDLRAVLRTEPAAGEIAIGFVLPLQGHEAGRQLAAEKPIVEKIERPIQRGIGFRGRIGGGHGGLFVSYETTIAHFMLSCKHVYMISC